MHLVALRIAAAFCALTWLVFPGFGLIDLSVTWDSDWPVVLEASWGVFMTVLVGGSFLAVAVRPRRTAAAQAILLVSLATWLAAAAAGLEWQLLGYVGVLLLEAGALFALLPVRERLRPVAWSVSPSLLVVAALGVVPWLWHALDVFRWNRGNAGVVIGDVTNGVDHYAVQGALALALVTLSLLAACWPRGRRHLGVVTGVCAAYLGVVSYAFPGTWAGLSPLWSGLAIAWALAVAVLSVTGSRSEAGEFGGEVVEAERTL